MGPWGEGFSGTSIKDTWTKPKGRVEAKEGGGFGRAGEEGWGENADNCNWTTIKKKEKIKEMGLEASCFDSEAQVQCCDQ